ncbi:PAS domain S-box-containing protein [Pararhizobium capsulatum DSM 1112]|uniref:histidine kinase n=1 Tax=Pararhizobium capsulatum DSM 1112 TaxID=1121113 RepID=A0ABU0C0K8_9HYPH|nr:response regulator [Pararhizobium capsulatum]MDQ0322627.1 PAS domain S-box-containing protein [Pararhizobium capsulatum DSM 1112]
MTSTIQTPRKVWPIGGGETGELIRHMDWSKTALGPMEQWPQHLRIKVNSIVNSPIPQVLMWGPDHIMLYNDGYVEIAGGYHPAALGGRVPDIWPEIWDWNRAILEAGFRGEVQSFRDQPMVLGRAGVPETVIFDLFYTPIYDEDGNVDGVLCTVLENTAKFQAQKDLAESRSELARLTSALPILVGFLDNERIYRFANDAYVEWFGLEPSQVIGRHVAEIINPDYYEGRKPFLTRAYAGETVISDTVIRRADGQPRHAEVRYTPRRTDEGDIDGIYVLIIDIEARKQLEKAQLEAQQQLSQHAADLEQQVRHRRRAEDQLRQLNENLEARVAAEIAERRQAELKLQHSQKMETIGKLTGGVAHDFNNLLQVVAGNLQLLMKDVSGNERAERRVSNALAGVSRGAKLASQLLAFGRRQALHPKVINVGRFVRDMDDMLRRSIGDGVEIETVIAGGLWNCLADPTQVENAILNLAINARDAMDGQGKLTVEVGNAYLDDDYATKHDEVAPGQYVVLSVSDTGSGIAPEILEQVFEPFFSTKAEGKGTGLGLSMVFGFVKQSGGHVKIYSEVGHGTTVKMYLPRAHATEDREVAIQSGPVVGGNETILVVEDDDEVRDTVVETLSDLGYKVLKAPNAEAALIIVEAGMAIDLLFTDVVMPGKLKSTELAKKARERQPDIAVLYTSGYTENSIVHGGRLDAGVELLSKPYPREALARKVRHVLANRSQRMSRIEEPAATVRVVAPARAEQLRILLVEDDSLIRMNTAEMLEDLGHKVHQAGSAAEAVALADRQPVDVLIADIGLPDMPGVEMAARIAAKIPNLPVIFASGHDENSAGLSDDAVLITKPYGSSDLDQALSLIRQRRSLSH